METKIRFVRMPEKDAPLAPQVMTILAVLKSKGPLTMAELAKAAKRRVKTVQPIARIFNHYRKPLLKGGFVKIERKKKGGAR